MDSLLQTLVKMTQHGMMRKLKMTSGLLRKTSFIAITWNPESYCTCRKKNHSPIPMKYIDVTRATQTSLDVLLEEQIDGYWNVDGERELSDAWTGFTSFILKGGWPPEGYTWSGKRRTRKTNNLKTRHLYGQMCGSICLMQQKAKRSKSWT